MSSIIYKYGLAVCDQQLIAMPQDAEILSVQEQDGSLQMWAKHDDYQPNPVLYHREIIIHGTGHPYPETVGLRYLATVQMPLGWVWHVFERRPQ